MKKLLLIPLLIACGDKSPCEEYIDYICSCHENNPDYDCSDMANMYNNPDADKEQECSTNLEEQKSIDNEAQLECTL